MGDRNINSALLHIQLEKKSQQTNCRIINKFRNQYNTTALLEKIFGQNKFGLNSCTQKYFVEYFLSRSNLKLCQTNLCLNNATIGPALYLRYLTAVCAWL